MSYEDYLLKHFYRPVGAKTLGFLPMSKNFSNKIVPTEVDTLYRHTLTKGKKWFKNLLRYNIRITKTEEG